MFLPKCFIFEMNNIKWNFNDYFQNKGFMYFFLSFQKSSLVEQKISSRKDTMRRCGTMSSHVYSYGSSASHHRLSLPDDEIRYVHAQKKIVNNLKSFFWQIISVLLKNLFNLRILSENLKKRAKFLWFLVRMRIGSINIEF